MSRCALVTGGAGFVGGHLTERLVTDGWTARVLDLAEPQLDTPVEWLEADVRDLDAMQDAARDADVVFHLGAVVGVNELLNDPLSVIDITVNGTRNALSAAAGHGAALVHLSSSEALGISPELPWTESTDRVIGSPLVDRWSYAAAKATAEHVVVAGSKSFDVPATVIRPFNVYGPRQRSRFVVPLMIDAALRGDAIPVNDSGTQTRCFTYVDDVVDAIVATAEKPAVEPLLHIGSDDEISILSLAERIAAAVGGECEIQFSSTADRYGDAYEDVIRRVPDPSLAMTSLGWAATTPLERGIAQTVAWARSVQ